MTSLSVTGTLPGMAALRTAAANSHNRFSDPHNGATARMWKRATVDVNIRPKFTLNRSDCVFTMGSCFARNVEHALVEAGVRVLPDKFDFPLELFEPAHADIARRANTELDFRVIVRSVLNKYSPLSMLNEFARVLEPEKSSAPLKGLVQVDEERWFDPQTKDTGMHRLQESLLVRSLIENATASVKDASAVFLTLGFTETWFDAETGMVLNMSPPPLLVRRWPERFRFFNASYGQVLEALEGLYGLLTRRVRPDMKFVVTVSPVPLHTTFTSKDIVSANTYSKATLRAAAEAFCDAHDTTDYYPSYEMVTSTLPDIAWKPDRMHVNQPVVDFVIAKFVTAYFAAPAKAAAAG